MRDDSEVQIDFRPMDAALPPASELLAAMVAEMGELYGDIEAGRRNATQTNLRKLAEVFNCPVVVLERKREQIGMTA